MAASSWSSSRASISAPLSTPAQSNPMSRAHLGCHQAVVAGDDLDLDARAVASLAMDAPASAFGRSAKVKKPTSVSPCSSAAVSVAACRSAGRVATATTRAPSENRRVERRLGAVGDVHAAVQDHLGGALGHQQRLPVGVRDQHRCQLPLVVEGQDAQPLVAGRPSRRARAPLPLRAPTTGPGPGRCPRPASLGHRRFVAHQPEQQRAVAARARRRRGPARR